MIICVRLKCVTTRHDPDDLTLAEMGFETGMYCFAELHRSGRVFVKAPRDVDASQTRKGDAAELMPCEFKFA